MLRTPRFLVVALPVVLVAAAYWLRPSAPRPISAQPATIEPTLPLTLDLHMLPADPDRGEPPRLEATVDATGDLQEVSLALVLPQEVKGDGEALWAGGATALSAGDRRVFVVPLEARHAGAYPIRLEASFRLPDGRIFHTQQGIVWSKGVGVPESRHNAGAFEWMGVPVEEPQP